MLRTQYNKSNSTSTKDKLQKQVDNYKTRLSSIGQDTNKQNKVEEFLGLPADQNILFDFLELLGRPQQALFGAIESHQNGESALEGAWEGLKGDKTTSGKELLTNVGWEDSDFNLLDTSTYSDLKGSDIAGAALDIYADPMDIPLIVLSGGTSLGVEAAADAAQTGKKAYRYTNLDKMLGLAQQGKHLASGNEIVGRGIGKAIKGTGKLANNAIEKGLGLANNGSLEVYQDLKKGAKNIANNAAQLKGFKGRANQIDGFAELERKAGKKAAEEIRSEAAKIAPKLNMETEEVLEELVYAIESKHNWDLTGQDIINKFKNTKNRTVDFLDTKTSEGIQKTLSDFGIKFDVDDTGRKITLKSNQELSKLYNIADAIVDEGDKVFKNKIYGSKNYANVNERMKEAYNLFKNGDDEVQAFFNEAQKAVPTQAGFASKFDDALRAGEAATDDYVKHSITEDVKRDIDKGFKSREVDKDASVLQVNTMKEEQRVADLAETESKLEKTQKSIYKTKLDKDGVEQLVVDADGNYIIDKSKYNDYVKQKENLVSNMKSNLDSTTEELKGLKGEVYNSSKLNKKGAKNVERYAKQLQLKQSIDDATDEVKEFLSDTRAMKNIPPESYNLMEDLGGKVKSYNSAITQYSKEVKEISKQTGISYNDLLKMSKQDAKIIAKNIKKGLDTAPAKTINKAYSYLNNGKKVIDKGTLEKIKKAYENVSQAEKEMKVALTKAKAGANTTYTKALSDVNKAMTSGKKAGENIANLENKYNKVLKKNNAVKQAAADTIDSLERNINYQEELLKKVKTVDYKEKWFDSKLKQIDDLQKQIDVLKSQEGQTFFKNQWDASYIDYVNAATAQNAGAKKFNDALATGLFNNESFVREKVEGEVAKWGYKEVDGNKLIKKFESYKPILSDDAKALGETLEQFRDKKLIIDSTLATALDVGARRGNEGIGPLTKLWDGINNNFKKFSTLTAGFQMRNIVGNTTNMWLSGMPASAMPNAYKEAATIWNNANNLVMKARDVGLDELTDIEKSQFNILKQFYEGGFGNALEKGYGLESIAESTKKGPLTKLSKLSLDANNKVDAINRLALLAYANGNTSYLNGLGVDNAVDAVKKVLFDPDNLTDTERNLFKKVIPFYTFTKQNLMFQADNIIRNAGRYTKLYKSMREVYNNLDEDEYYNYQKENFQLPLPFKDDDGNQIFLKTNLPISDLGEYLSNPIQRIASSTSPVIKYPFEKVTGINTFTGEETNYTAGNDLLNAIGVNTSQGVESALSEVEQLLNNLGMSNVSNNLIKKVTAIINRYNGDTSNQEMWAEILRSLVQNTNSENVKISGLYDELERYQEEIQRLKNQGIDVPTIKEITASNSISLNKLKNKRTKSN